MLGRNISNALALRKKTIDEKLGMPALKQLLEELPKEAEVDVLYADLSKKMKRKYTGEEASGFVDDVFYEDVNADVFFQGIHQVYMGPFSEKHYFDVQRLKSFAGIGGRTKISMASAVLSYLK